MAGRTYEVAGVWTDGRLLAVARAHLSLSALLVERSPHSVVGTRFFFDLSSNHNRSLKDPCSCYPLIPSLGLPAQWTCRSDQIKTGVGVSLPRLVSACESTPSPPARGVLHFSPRRESLPSIPRRAALSLRSLHFSTAARWWLFVAKPTIRGGSPVLPAPLPPPSLAADPSFRLIRAVRIDIGSRLQVDQGCCATQFLSVYFALLV